MKRDFNETVKTIEGQPYKDGNPTYKLNVAGEIEVKDGKPVIEKDSPNLTVGKIVIVSIDTPLEGDERIPWKDKIKLSRLAFRIKKGIDSAEPVEIDTDELSTLEDRVSRLPNTSMLILGQVLAHLDTDYKEPEKKDQEQEEKA